MSISIKEYIRKYVLLKINSEEWAVGTSLPTEREMCIKFSCSRMTVRAAFAPLISTGILNSKQGKGYVVAEHSQDGNLNSISDTYNIDKTEVEIFNGFSGAFYSVFNIDPNENVFGISKKYYSKKSLVAAQITMLNNDYLWEKNIEGFKKSITKELALQGSVITHSNIRVSTKSFDDTKHIEKLIGKHEYYIKEFIKSFTIDSWIEATVRITSPSLFHLAFNKRKY